MMFDRVTIAARYSFEAAHHLPTLPDGHKCKRMHGHNYRLDVSLTGTLDERGFVMDYAELDAIVQPLVDKLDHRLPERSHSARTEASDAWIYEYATDAASDAGWRDLGCR